MPKTSKKRGIPSRAKERRLVRARRYRDISPLGLRVWNVLDAMGVETIGDLADLTAKELLERPHFGPKCLLEVRDALAGVGLALQGESVGGLRASRRIQLSQLAAAFGVPRLQVKNWFLSGMLGGKNLGPGSGRGVVLSEEEALVAARAMILWESRRVRVVPDLRVQPTTRGEMRLGPALVKDGRVVVLREPLVLKRDEQRAVRAVRDALREA